MSPFGRHRHHRPISSSLGMGLGGIGNGAPGPSSPAVEPNPNLLLWSEAKDNAVWTKTSASVAADTHLDPGSQITADTLTIGATGAIRQVTATPATTGAASIAVHETTTGFQRFTVSGTFDATDYVFSVYILDEGGGSLVRLRIDRSGGFLRCSIEGAGDALVIVAAWAKLETPTLTAYVKREGT